MAVDMGTDESVKMVDLLLQYNARTIRALELSKSLEKFD